VLLCQLLTYKLAAHFLGKSGFSEYAVARRTISFIYSLPLLGLAVALPRYVAHAIGAGDGPRSGRYFGAAVWCAGLGLLACVILMNAFPGTFAYLFFASKEYASLVLPLSLLLIGLVLHCLVYSYFRGQLAMGRANLLQLVNFGIVPLAAFVFFHSSVHAVLTVLGMLTSLVAAVGLAFAPLGHIADRILPEAKELLRYGVQRIPGDFGQMALFTLPVTFVAHSSGVQEAGYVAFGISVLNMIGSMFAPFGLILLPKAGRMLAGGDHAELRRHVFQLAKVTVFVSVTLALFLEIFAGTLIKLYLGPNFSEAVFDLRILVLAALPFCLYMVLRNLVDAFHENAVNTRNILFALAIFLAGAIALQLNHSRLSYGMYALVASTYLLGVLTLLEARKILSS
jgi:O-antigen/teichoic acid export membrane protein